MCSGENWTQALGKTSLKRWCGEEVAGAKVLWQENPREGKCGQEMKEKVLLKKYKAKGYFGCSKHVAEIGTLKRKSSSVKLACFLFFLFFTLYLKKYFWESYLQVNQPIFLEWRTCLFFITEELMILFFLQPLRDVYKYRGTNNNHSWQRFWTKLLERNTSTTTLYPLKEYLPVRGVEP